MTSTTVGNWTDLNRNLRTLLFYGATAGVGPQGELIYGGLQDNGTGQFFPWQIGPRDPGALGLNAETGR